MGDVFGRNSDAAKNLKGRFRHRPCPLFHRRRLQRRATSSRCSPIWRAAASRIAHNGNLTNAHTLRSELVAEGAIFQSTSDTETIVHLAARSPKSRIVDKLIDALCQVEGAYSLVALTSKKLIGVRDPYGVRPLVLGKLDGAPILASETCALDIIGAEFVRDIEPGEMVVVDQGRHRKPFPLQAAAAPLLRLRIHLFRAARFHGGRPQRL